MSSKAATNVIKKNAEERRREGGGGGWWRRRRLAASVVAAEAAGGGEGGGSSRKARVKDLRAKTLKKDPLRLGLRLQFRLGRRLLFFLFLSCSSLLVGAS